MAQMEHGDCLVLMVTLDSPVTQVLQERGEYREYPVKSELLDRRVRYCLIALLIISYPSD